MFTKPDIIHEHNYLSDKELFIRTLSDIRQKLQGDNYDRIRACGLLRHLFLDERPLLHIVNREYKLKILFRINPLTTPIDMNALFYWHNIEPDDEKAVELLLNEFLKQFIILNKKVPFDVIDIIKGASHLLGGIHSGVPKEEREKAVVQLFKESGFVVLVINAICNVSLDALSPLEDLIQGHTPTGGL